VSEQGEVVARDDVLALHKGEELLARNQRMKAL
jgi:hypothetical protein